MDVHIIKSCKECPMWLIINENAEKFVDKFRLFTKDRDMLKAAIELGWEKQYGHGLSDKLGILNVYSCGDVDIKIIKLEPDASVKPPELHPAMMTNPASGKEETIAMPTDFKCENCSSAVNFYPGEDERLICNRCGSCLCPKCVNDNHGETLCDECDGQRLQDSFEDDCVLLNDDEKESNDE